MTSQLAFFSIDIVAVFMVLVFGARVLSISPKDFNARLLALICLDSVCAVLLSRFEMAQWIPKALQVDVGVLRLPMQIARNLTPGLMMIFVYSLFQDQRKFPRGLIVAFALQVVMEVLAYVLVSDQSSQYIAVRAVPAVLELSFVGLALYWSLTGWRADLVEARRKLRWVFLVIIGLVIFIDVLVRRLIIPWGMSADFYAHVASSCLLLLIGTAALVALRSDEPNYINPFRDEKKSARPDRAEVATNDETERTAAAIRRALAEDHLFRNGELTIASLAAKLSLPEYRVRKAIHERLGYRNFNALLHDYRIADACRDLSDPKKDHLPILTIALTVGYNSINPFNRAFRDLKGTTPSGFRAEAQQKVTPNSAK